MLQYEIAGLKLGIIHDRSNKFKDLKLFEAVYTGRPDIEIRFQSSGYFPVRKYDGIDNDEIRFHTEYDGDKTLIYVYLTETDRTEYVIEADSDWSDISIRYHEKAKGIEEAFCTYLGNFIISNKIIHHDGLVIHASSVMTKSKGIIFTAPSGTGKSTHAALWKKHHNAVIINDDSPVICCRNDQILICGTPWSGAGKKAMNISSPLSAVVILEQSDSNSLRRLTDDEAIPLLIPRMFLPYYNPVLMNKALEIADKVLKAVPKYHLKCRADKEATELVYQCVM